MMRRIYLKAILLSVALCLGAMTSFGQETLTKPPKPGQSQSKTINGHEYVDLGLSVKWATCNVGASSPEGYGNYYAWGETKTKPTYTWENCSTWDKNMGDIAGNPNYDAARANWGSPWRLPTKDEIQELEDNCISSWTTIAGVRGRLFKSKKNGNSIFLPAAGYRLKTSLNDDGESSGFYWSSSPFGSDTQSACGISFDSGDFGWDWAYRYDGRGVRPVCD